MAESNEMMDLDGRVLAKALACAIALIDGLPDQLRKREASDRDDMVYLMNVVVPDAAERERYAIEAERITGTLPDLTDWKGREKPVIPPGP